MYRKKGIVLFTIVELIQVFLKTLKAKEAKMREKEVTVKSRNIQVTILQWQ